MWDKIDLSVVVRVINPAQPAVIEKNGRYTDYS